MLNRDVPLQAIVTQQLSNTTRHFVQGQCQSTITEKMAAVHFPSNAFRSKIFREANGCVLKDRRKAGGRFVYFC